MQMKQSYYNLLFKKDERKLVYNQLSTSILELDDTLYRCLINDDIEKIPEDIKESLAKSSILIDDDLDEKNVVLYRVQHAKYDDSFIRVTIMPTLNCNFKCWYCYENHHESKMSPERMENVLCFCQRLIEQDKSRTFQLDWFGGEPLLYFQEIMYPLAYKIKQLCELNDVKFCHSITTNGYLINNDVIKLMKEINLSSFQITLDGSSNYHNKTRFTDSDKNSYKTIVNNITSLCRFIPNIDMTLRINYTPKNLASIPEIINDFPLDVRNKIQVCPQLVWQFKKDINATTDNIKNILIKFQRAGYKTHKKNLICHQCYAESMNQYVINYDLTVFKCTARDFIKKHSVGKISHGSFFPNSHYFDYCITSDIINEKCANCKLMPSCLGRCVQKRVEGNYFNCDIENLKMSIINDILLYINANE